MQYLSKLELLARVRIGKAVEQWLSYYHEDNYAMIEWLSIEKNKHQFSVTYLKSFDEGDENFQDIYEFSFVDPNDNPFDKATLFDTAEEAVTYAVEHYKASADKFVAEGMLAEEYATYQRNKHQ